MDSTGSHIESVKMLVDPKNDSYYEGLEFKREDVVAKLKAGRSVITVRGKIGDWRKGDKVILYGDKYITTEGNSTSKQCCPKQDRFCLGLVTGQ